MTGPRSRPRAYLALARVSNLPTVWTNVLAGTIAATGAVASVPRAAVVAAAVSLLYVGGMFLNDGLDAGFDATYRPDRPIAAGEVTARETYVAGFALIASGLLALGVLSGRALGWGGALAAAVLYYDWRHKRDPLGPLVMGLCRGLVYFIAAAAAEAAAVSTPAILAAAIMTAYVTALTGVAKLGGARCEWSVKYLIAGICLLDAAIIAATGSVGLAVVAALGFPLTLLAQKWVAGT